VVDVPTKSLRYHARQRMAERNISDEAIDWVLANYHTRRPAPVRDPAEPVEILQGTFNGRDIKVYVVSGSNPPIVKTVA